MIGSLGPSRYASLGLITNEKSLAEIAVDALRPGNSSNAAPQNVFLRKLRFKLHRAAYGDLARRRKSSGAELRVSRAATPGSHETLAREATTIKMPFVAGLSGL